MVSWLVASIGLVSLMFSAIGRSLESGTWEGFFTSGRAGRIFRPCGSRATWWVQNPSFESTADELEQRYQEITSHPYEQIYVRIRGEASRKGQYGPLGSYQRVVYVQGTEFLIVLGSGTFLLGLALIIWISVTKRRGYGTPNWPTVDGHVLSSTAVELERETSDGMVSTFTPIIRYEYDVAGTLHTSARLNFLSDEHRTFKDRRAAGQVVAKYPIGASVAVFYNPANPQQAALDIPKPAAHNAVLYYGATNLVAGALIIALGIVLL